MPNDQMDRRQWMAVVGFGAAMAWMEAACVFYLRTLVGRVEPYQANPLPIDGALGTVELWREAATIIMIAVVGFLGGRTWRQRCGYAALAFGTWDLCYYLFLRVICGWPKTMLDWDVLFLLPLPWWGPVLAPICIALLMMVWGTLATQTRPSVREAAWVWALTGVGIAVALGMFMNDAWRALPGGREDVLRVLPARFNWATFGVALLLMAAPIVRQLVTSYESP